MKLKTFDKVNVSVTTNYTVFQGETPVDDFTVDYLDIDRERLNKAIMKKYMWMQKGADVEFVTIGKYNGEEVLDVTLLIK